MTLGRSPAKNVLDRPRFSQPATTSAAPVAVRGDSRNEAPPAVTALPRSAYASKLNV